MMGVGELAPTLGGTGRTAPSPPMLQNWPHLSLCAEAARARLQGAVTVEAWPDHLSYHQGPPQCFEMAHPIYDLLELVKGLGL